MLLLLLLLLLLLSAVVEVGQLSAVVSVESDP